MAFTAIGASIGTIGYAYSNKTSDPKEANFRLFSPTITGSILDAGIGIAILIIGVLGALHVLPLPMSVTWLFVGAGTAYLVSAFMASAFNNTLFGFIAASAASDD